MEIIVSYLMVTLCFIGMMFSGRIMIENGKADLINNFLQSAFNMILFFVLAIYILKFNIGG